jgi:S1-C subfamily serine protease
MTTRATVSKQKQTNRIILDASFNQGFSGAPFFVANETDRLMLAGIVTAAASSTKNILVPEFQSHEKQYNPNNPYKGNIFAGVDERIRYGITFTLNSGEIKDFYIENKHLFNNKNISLHRVFNLGNL